MKGDTYDKQVQEAMGLLDEIILGSQLDALNRDDDGLVTCQMMGFTPSSEWIADKVEKYHKIAMMK